MSIVVVSVRIMIRMFLNSVIVLCGCSCDGCD